jgi:ribose transport system permease protein
MPLLVFGLIVAVFGWMDDRFLEWHNLVNILNQSAPVAILAIGMTFVLLTAGIDLSVGSVMYLGVVLFGVYLPDIGASLALVLCAVIGLTIGAINAFCVIRLRVAAFIVTLAMLSILRGIGRGVSETQVVRFSSEITDLGRAAYWGVPWALWIFAGILGLASIVLRQTPHGRRIYAVGENPENAAKAGINVAWILFTVYCFCGCCAGITGFVSLTQVGAAAPSFGLEWEFAAIAAAVLGGTSLFGGRGSELGALFGAVLIKTVNNGLVIINANEYAYPLITAGLIFFAVLLDSVRNRMIHQLNRPRIRIEAK